MLKVRVVRKDIEALDICTVEFKSIDRRPLPAFSAGSHIDVHLPNGLIRQYSLCNAPSERHRYVIAVLKDPATRGGSQAIHELRTGDVLAISEPRNHFLLAHNARRSLLFAGGIGITPILCMAERLAAIGEAFEMHYCSRSKERTAFIDRIVGAPFASQVSFHFDDGPPDQRLDMNELLAFPEPGTHVYVCGPKGFIEAVLKVARAVGWAEANLHSEFFSAQQTKSDTDGSFEVMLASSGRLIVIPGDKTVVQALSEAGIEIATSCEEGVCGTCVTRVLEGQPDHRDFILTTEQQQLNDQFMPCCSRAVSERLVLDL